MFQNIEPVSNFLKFYAGAQILSQSEA